MYQFFDDKWNVLFLVCCCLFVREGLFLSRLPWIQWAILSNLMYSDFECWAWSCWKQACLVLFRRSHKFCCCVFSHPGPFFQDSISYWHFWTQFTYIHTYRPGCFFRTYSKVYLHLKPTFCWRQVFFLIENSWNEANSQVREIE